MLDDVKLGASLCAIRVTYTRGELLLEAILMIVHLAMCARRIALHVACLQPHAMHRFALRDAAAHPTPAPSGWWQGSMTEGLAHH
jgi:hypothetical protein